MFKKILLFILLTLILTSCDMEKNLDSLDKDVKTQEKTQTLSPEDVDEYTDLFENYSKENSIIILENLSDPSITKKAILKDKNDELLGYAYTMNGKNAYGQIILLVCIDD